MTVPGAAAEKTSLPLCIALLSTLVACDFLASDEPTPAPTPPPPVAPQGPDEPETFPLPETELPEADPNAWIREVEKDPIGALKTLDPGALQAKRPTPSGDLANTDSEPEPGRRRAQHGAAKPGRLTPWPPIVGRPYPDIELADQWGGRRSFRDFRGKVVLIEVVGLTCRACHAFAGGNEPSVGRFRNINPQQGLGSIEEYARRAAKVSLGDSDVVFVQLVLYGMDGRSAPKPEDVQAWARHFGMRDTNEVVLVGDARFISPATRRLIPGFHLVDRNGVLRALSSNNPRHHNLFSDLLPMLGRLVRREG